MIRLHDYFLPVFPRITNLNSLSFIGQPHSLTTGHTGVTFDVPLTVIVSGQQDF